MYLFSAKTFGFYPKAEIDAYINAGTLPEDTIEVSEDIRNEYNVSPPAGFKLGTDSSGMPAWVDLTAKEKNSNNELLRASLRSAADSEINWRQDASDAGIATQKELSELAEWKKYRVLLMRVDLTNPTWPTVPFSVD